ncbi:MAG: PQQ-dependent sugar dehydrogenase [Solirubrobacteraceae bacterium]
MVIVLAAGVAIVLALASSSHGPPLLGRATIGPPLLQLVKVGSFDQPDYVTAPPGDRRRLFVVERTGRIRVLRDGRPLAAPFLDLSPVVNYSGGEQGLLSMAFAPDYAKSGRFYVDYTGKDNDVRVLEYRRSTPERADPRTRRLVVLLRKQKTHSLNPRKRRKHKMDEHNGGLLLFGPDRLLYIGIGDGGANYDKYNNAQNLGSLLGKILRVDPRPSGNRPYRIPPDNPFVHRPGARPEVYDYGLRNPWRFDFDRAGGMAIADVGEQSEEEIDFEPRGRTAGRNYGWRVFEGFRKAGTPPAYAEEERAIAKQKAPGAVFPVFAYKHPPHPPTQKTRACLSIIGGNFVRDRTLRGYAGRFLYGDFCSGRIYSIVLNSGSSHSNFPAVARPVTPLTSFGEDAAKHIYVCAQGGPVYRLTSPGLLSSQPANPYR